jgi:hypothetical protein
MAIRRPGAIAPHPLGPKRSGGRRAATCLSREECRGAAGERSCRPPLRVAIEAQPTLGQISPSEAAWHASPDRPGKLIATGRAATQENVSEPRKKSCLQVSSAPKGWRRRRHAPISCHGIAQREFGTACKARFSKASIPRLSSTTELLSINGVHPSLEDRREAVAHLVLFAAATKGASFGRITLESFSRERQCASFKQYAQDPPVRRVA